MTQAEAARRLRETRRKLELEWDWLQATAQERTQEGASGRVVVEFIWQDGYIAKARHTAESTLTDDVQDTLGTSSNASDCSG